MSLILPIQKPVFPTNEDLQKRYEQALALTRWESSQVSLAVEIVLYGYAGMPGIPRSPERAVLANILTQKLHGAISHHLQALKDQQLVVRVVSEQEE